MDTELDGATIQRLREFADLGDSLAREGDYRTAIQVYNDGWDLLPEPRNQWDAAAWILAAIADAAYLGGFLTTARQALDYVMTCPGAIGNPFLHLRRGEVIFDQGEPEGAADELIRAYMGAGLEIFRNEAPRYLEFLRTRANIAD